MYAKSLGVYRKIDINTKLLDQLLCQSFIPTYFTSFELFHGVRIHVNLVTMPSVAGANCSG